MAGYSEEQVLDIIKGIKGLAEAKDFFFARTLFMDSYEQRDVKSDFTLIDRVVDGQSIPIFLAQNDFGSFPGIDSDTCDLPEGQINDEWTKYKWELGSIGEDLGLCLTKLTEDFNVFFDIWARNNGDDVNLAFVQFVRERFQTKHINAEARVYFFGDKASSNLLIKPTNGIFTQAMARATADPALRVKITENDAQTVAEQELSGEAIYNYLDKAIKIIGKTPNYKIGSMRIIISIEQAQELANFLNGLDDLKGYSCDCIDPNKVINSRVFQFDNLRIQGHPVYVYDLTAMQRALGTSHFDKATGLYVHRNIMMVTRDENVLVGYGIEETLSQFKIGYEERKNVVWLQGRSKLAPGLPTDAFVIAY